MRDNFVSFVSPSELQKELLIYSDGMGFEKKNSFYIERKDFNNYLVKANLVSSIPPTHLNTDIILKQIPGITLN